MNRTKALLESEDEDQITSQKVFEAVCMDASENVNADLVSVWFFDEKNTQIECQCVYLRDSNEFARGLILRASDYPKYFKSIVEENIISAPDARNHPITSEFTDGYFKPNGIVSLLDFILHKDGKAVGVICCENRGEIRHWSKGDKNYLRALATLTSFHFEI